MSVPTRPNSKPSLHFYEASGSRYVVPRRSPEQMASALAALRDDMKGIYTALDRFDSELQAQSSRSTRLRQEIQVMKSKLKVHTDWAAREGAGRTSRKRPRWIVPPKERT